MAETSTPAGPLWRLTPRGRAVAVGVLLALLAGLFVVTRPLVAPYLPGGQHCTVGRTDPVRLDPADALVVTRRVAADLRAGGSLTRTVSGLAGDDTLDLDTREATLVARALTGRDQASLTCAYDADVTLASPKLGLAGLTARAAVVRRDLDRAFGRQAVGGFAPGGVTTGHQPGSAHYEGRAVDVFFRPISSAGKRRGWAVAQYLVANADRLDLATVIFDGRIWTTQRSGQGWRPYRVDTSARPARTVAILEHRDHVHVDVFR